MAVSMFIHIEQTELRKAFNKAASVLSTFKKIDLTHKLIEAARALKIELIFLFKTFISTN